MFHGEGIEGCDRCGSVLPCGEPCAITVQVAAGLEPADFAALGTAQLVALSQAQAAALTSAQIAALSPAKLAVLEEVDLGSEYLARYPVELSGGQRQRVNIARAVAVSPELLICDEIVSALDVTVQAQVLELLSRLRRTRRLSLIFISHDLAVVGALCNRTLVMRNARVVEESPTHDILTAPLTPYTRSLVNAARELEPDGQLMAIQPS